MGGVEVQRVTRFVIHLPEYGWEPVVITSNGGYHASWDTTLLGSLSDNLVVFRVGAFEHFSNVRKKNRLMKGAVVDREFRNSHYLRDRLLRKLEDFDRKYLCFPDEKNWWANRAFLPAVGMVRK